MDFQDLLLQLDGGICPVSPQELARLIRAELARGDLARAVSELREQQARGNYLLAMEYGGALVLVAGGPEAARLRELLPSPASATGGHDA